jgi:hypothetical protein
MHGHRAHEQAGHEPMAHAPRGIRRYPSRRPNRSPDLVRAQPRRGSGASPRGIGLVVVTKSRLWSGSGCAVLVVGSVTRPDRVMAIRWPRREDHHYPTTARARDLVPLVGLERQQRARSCLDGLTTGLDVRGSLDNHQPSPLAHLVLTELLTGREANDDRSRPVDGLKRCRPTCPLGGVKRIHIPGLHVRRF